MLFLVAVLLAIQCLTYCKEHGTLKLIKIKCLHPPPPIVDDSNTMMDSNNNIVESRTDTNQNMDLEMCLCIGIAKALQAVDLHMHN